MRPRPGTYELWVICETNNSRRLLLRATQKSLQRLISTLLLQMHARQLYSLTLTRFLLHLGGLPLRMYGMPITHYGHYEYLDHGSRETHAQQQRRPTQIVVSCSLFKPLSRLNHFVHHEISYCCYCYKPRSKHGAIAVKSTQHFTSGPKIFHYPKNQICLTRSLKIIFNAQLITTQYSSATFSLIEKN